MRTAVFSTRPYDRRFLDNARRAARSSAELVFFEASLDPTTAALAEGFEAACLFVNDRADGAVLEQLAAAGVRLLALRSAGFNHVDLVAAERLGLTVLRVPAYSPSAVAEHTVALVMTLNRRIHRAYNRVREQNFELDGLLGFDLAGKTIGVVGTGNIGTIVARIMLGFGCRVVAADPDPAAEARSLGIEFLALEALLEQSDVITLHCPLTPATHHLVDAAALARTRPGVMLINTSRGGVVDTRALIAALKTRHVGALGIDVYEEEGDLFFRDLSDQVITDDVFARLLTFPNVLITAHQAFFTHEAMTAIAATTIANIDAFAAGEVRAGHRVTAALVTSASG